MPTFLTTSRMSPELRRRIERSVARPSGGERFAAGRTPTSVAIARLVIVSSLLAVALALGWSFVKSRREFAAEQHSLLERAAKAERSLSAPDRARLANVDAWAARIAAKPEADFAEDEASARWRSAVARRALLETPFFYLRGDVAQLNSHEGRRAIVSEGAVDALPGCLVAPPDSEKESVLLRRIGRRAPENVVPALEAQALLDFSGARFSASVRAAEHMRQLRELDVRLGRERIVQRQRRSDVSLLLLVVDEPKAAGTASDFDGEAPHHLRVVFVDLRTGEEHLRVRRAVDPAWISDKSRLQFSRALDSCKLARQLHEGW